MANDAPIAHTILANDDRVHYDESWQRKPNSTSFFTTKSNATASLTFNGTLIQAYGVTGIEGAQATFLLNCSEALTLPLSPSNSSIPLFNPGLQFDTEHQLTIITRNDSLPFTLDSFLITARPSRELTGRDIPELSQCAVPPRRPASNENAPASTSGNHRPHPGVIAGVVVGVAALLALVLFLFLFLRRRRLYPRQVSAAEKGFNIIELEPMDDKKSRLYDLLTFKRRRPAGSTPPVSNTLTNSTGLFSSVIMILPFYPSTTSGSVPDTDHDHPRQ